MTRALKLTLLSYQEDCSRDKIYNKLCCVKWNFQVEGTLLFTKAYTTHKFSRVSSLSTVAIYFNEKPIVFKIRRTEK